MSESPDEFAGSLARGLWTLRLKGPPFIVIKARITLYHAIPTLRVNSQDARLQLGSAIKIKQRQCGRSRVIDRNPIC